MRLFRAATKLENRAMPLFFAPTLSHGSPTSERRFLLGFLLSRFRLFTIPRVRADFEEARFASPARKSLRVEFLRPHVPALRHLAESRQGRSRNRFHFRAGQPNFEIETVLNVPKSKTLEKKINRFFQVIRVDKHYRGICMIRRGNFRDLPRHPVSSGIALRRNHFEPIKNATIDQRQQPFVFRLRCRPRQAEGGKRTTNLIIERKLNIVLPFCYPTR